MRSSESKGGKKPYESMRLTKQNPEIEKHAVNRAFSLAEKLANALIDSSRSAAGAAGPSLAQNGLGPGGHVGYEAVSRSREKGFFRDGNSPTGWSYTNGQGDISVGVRAPGLARNGVISADADGLVKSRLASEMFSGLSSPAATIDSFDGGYIREDKNDPIYEAIFGSPRMGYERGTPMSVRLNDMFGSMGGVGPTPPVHRPLWEPRSSWAQIGPGPTRLQIGPGSSRPQIGPGPTRLQLGPPPTRLQLGPPPVIIP